MYFVSLKGTHTKHKHVPTYRRPTRHLPATPAPELGTWESASAWISAGGDSGERVVQVNAELVPVIGQPLIELADFVLVFGGDDVVGSVVIAAAGDQPVFDSRAWSAWI